MPGQSLQFKARMAGFFWLMTFLLGAFAMAIAGRFLVTGDVVATASNILAHELAFRSGAAANLVATACYLTATILVYVLLKPVNKNASLLAAFFSLLGCAIGAFSFLFYFAPLVLLSGASYLSVFTAEQQQTLAFVSLKLAANANDLGLIFFGLHILLVGVLIIGSIFLPRAIGLLLTIGGLCYLTNSFASFLALPFARNLFPYILLPAFIAELSLILWLLVKGVNVQQWKQQAGAADSFPFSLTQPNET